MPFIEPSITDGTDSLCFLSELSPHDKPWDIHRARAEAIACIYNQLGSQYCSERVNFSRYSERMRECSQWLLFDLRRLQTGEIGLKLFFTRFCRVRHCPVCQWRRALMWRGRFLSKMPRVIQDNPQARYIFLTLTVRNCPVTELRETVRQMNTAWKRLIGRKNFPGIGFIRSLEVTRGSDGTAHPHFHCFLMVKSSYFKKAYLSQKAWTELWQSCLKINYTPVVNVKAIRSNKALPETSHVDALVPAICETLKYSVKESDLIANPEWLAGITEQLHKTRAVSVGGILKNYFSEDDPEDLIHTDVDSDEQLENAMGLIFDWSCDVKKYKARANQ